MSAPSPAVGGERSERDRDAKMSAEGWITVKALACDYDGTLASQDRMAASTSEALARARRAGLLLVLVTGRAFFELTRVCERLDLFDAVVGENGAVVYFPGEGRICDLGIAPPPRLLAELDRRGVPFQVGRVIVATARGYEPDVRASLAAAGATRELAFNRAALMLLPAGVSKGTGLDHIVRTLGLSPHDVLGLGDAENDLDLFEACGIAACPGNAVPEAKERADLILAGDDGMAVARMIDAGLVPGGLRLPPTARHRLEIGWSAETGAAVSLPDRGVNVLIQGDPGSGKSWIAGALVERLVASRYSVCVIDPEGDYEPLAALPGVEWTELRDEARWDDVVGGLRRDPSASAVVDLSLATHADKVGLVEAGLVRLRRLRDERGRPHWIVLDEAHYLLHGEGVSAAALAAHDKGFCWVTYKSGWLRPSLLAAVDLLIVGRTTEPSEVALLVAALDGGGAAGALGATLSRLPRQEFVLLDRARGHLTTFVAPPRLTGHVRHLRKYCDRPVGGGLEFLFRSRDGAPVATASTLGEFGHAVRHVGEPVLAYHAARGDFSRWLSDVFQTRELSGRLRKVERRWCRGEIDDLRGSIVQALSHLDAPPPNRRRAG